jgi:hypothetical protein
VEAGVSLAEFETFRLVRGVALVDGWPPLAS